MSHSQKYFGRVLVGMICVMTAALPATAQSVSDVRSANTFVPESRLAPTSPIVTSGAAESPVGIAPRRSRTVSALQVSFGALQVMDVVSTVRGLNAGLTEANVAMRGIAERPMALATVKAGAAAATVLLVNRMARRNRGAAIVTMLALNTAYSVTVARNVRALRDH